VYQKQSGNIVIDRIKVTPEFDRDHQGELSKRLSKCSPITKTLAGWSGTHSSSGALDPNLEAFLGAISTELQQPIAALSAGPTAEDKHWL
jgi:adenylosuccinate synthase